MNGQKVGGNVATYFCLADGSVLHIVPGPVDAATLLREARWVVELRKLAMTDSGGDYRAYQELFRNAHAERLRQEYRVRVDPRKLGQQASAAPERRGPWKSLSAHGRVHLLLAREPMTKIERVYRVVFEKVLGEKVSTLPVQEGA